MILVIAYLLMIYLKTLSVAQTTGPNSVDVKGYFIIVIIIIYHLYERYLQLCT
jgi:hypothetical protein